MKVFLDLDGTLSDVARRHHRVYADVIGQLCGKPLPIKTYWGHKRDKMAWPMLLELSGVNGELAEEFLRAFVARVEQPDYLKMDKLFPGSLHVVAALGLHYKCYLVSLRRSNEALVAQLDELGLATHFELVLSGYPRFNDGDSKFELISRQLRLGESGAVIGDTEADVESGKRLGLITIAMSTGIRSASFLANLEPTRVLSDIRDVPALLLSDSQSSG